MVVSGGWPHLWVLDPEGKPISERVNHKTSIGETLKMMRDSLRTAKREVPAWLELVTNEYTVERETTAFAMGCFWSGERKLGGIDGVLKTRVGGRQSKGEWVEVEFDPTVVSYEELVKSASEMKCASAVVARSGRAGRNRPGLRIRPRAAVSGRRVADHSAEEPQCRQALDLQQ